MRICSVLAIATVLTTAPALAEEDEQTIVVTGTRYTETPTATGSKTGTDPRDVPAAIVVIPAEVLKDQNARDLDRALRNASAVAPSFGGGYGLADNYVVRGLPMRFLRDGLPDGSTFNGYRRTLADVDTIEVLKGPGSALYGRAEAGGSVNLTTRAPAAIFGASAEASYGSFDSWSANGDITGPIADGVAARLIGNYERADGYRGLARRYVDILPTVIIARGKHRLTFDYDHREQRVTVDNYGQPFTTARTLAAVDPASRFYSPFNNVDQRIDRFTLSDTMTARDDLTVRAAVVYDTRALSFARNAGGNAINAAGVMTGRGGRTQSDNVDYWTGQAEAVWTPHTGTVAHTLLFGAEYAATEISSVRRTYVLPDIAIANGTASAPETAIPALTSPGFDRRIASDTLSVYAQEQADIADIVKLRGGIRLDSVKLVDDGTVVTTRRRIAGSTDLVSWQVGAVVKPAKWISLYGGYARGKFIAVNTEASALSPIPESSSQIEAGVKTTLLGGKLSANIAAFETRRDDFFVTLVAGGDPVQVGAQTSRGVEFDIIGNPVKGLSIVANAAYVDARNRSSALASITGIATNVSTLGKRLASTPEWSGSVWATYELQTGPLAGLTLGGGASYKGATFADALELLRVPSYTIFGGAIGYRTRRFDVQLNIENIGNATWYSVPTFIGAQPGTPRSFSLTVRTRL